MVQSYDIAVEGTLTDRQVIVFITPTQLTVKVILTTSPIAFVWRTVTHCVFTYQAAKKETCLGRTVLDPIWSVKKIHLIYAVPLSNMCCANIINVFFFFFNFWLKIRHCRFEFSVQTNAIFFWIFYTTVHFSANFSFLQKDSSDDNDWLYIYIDIYIYMKGCMDDGGNQVFEYPVDLCSLFFSPKN